MENKKNRLTDETSSAQESCLPVPVKKPVLEKRTVWRWLMFGALLLAICLCVRACRARDEPAQEQNWVYEEDQTPTPVDTVPSTENRRVNLALAKRYEISEEQPVFYIGFPEENIFDVTFTLRDSRGGLLYQTDRVASGTNVAINGTQFLQKGTHAVDCLVSVYDPDSGTLISDCTTITLQIDYE